MMEQEELKRKLLGLWEKTTHNSKEMLSILFDYYFDIRYLEYQESEGKVVGALCGIPDSFGFGQNRLKGLYLISLSSEEGFRKRGILAELLQNMNQRISKEFDFTFLVPHTELLADYFGTQGYFSSFFILEERFTPIHDFTNDYLILINDSEERIRNLKSALLKEINVIENNEESIFPKEQIIKFIEEIEKKATSSVNLNHTVKDLGYILSEGSIRNLRSYIAYDGDGRITGVMFSQKGDINRVNIVASFVADICSYYALLEFIKKHNHDFSLSVITSDPKFQTHYLIQQTYASENPAGGDLDTTISTLEIPFNINKLLQPLGMVRLLRFDRIMEYIANTRSDVEFKLHIRNFSLSHQNLGTDKNDSQPEDDKVVFVVKNGKCQIEPFAKFQNDRTVLNLTKKEVSELLLRKNDSSNLIMEAFGIPRLNLQMRLLPC